MNTLSKSAWQLLGDYLKDTQLLGSIQSTLYWDQNTSMPISGSTWRGEQLSLLAKQLHARQSSEQFEILIKEAKSELQNLKGHDEIVLDSTSTIPEHLPVVSFIYVPCKPVICNLFEQSI